MLRDAPLLLLEPWTALRALRPTGVVLAATHQNIGVALWVRKHAVVGVPVAHAAAADTDVLDAVEVLRTRARCLGSPLNENGSRVSRFLLRSIQQTFLYSNNLSILKHPRKKWNDTLFIRIVSINWILLISPTAPATSVPSSVRK